MRKDIQVPQVKDVYIAVVQEEHPEFKTLDWNAYIINDKAVDLEMVLIVSKGYDENTETSTMRHKLDKLPAKSYAKIELMQDAVLKLNNTFKVTFFEGNQMYDKTFLFRKNTVNTKALQPLPLMQFKGVLVK